MEESLKMKTGIPVFATIGWLVILVAGMRAADSILVPFLFSVFLAIICGAPVFWLKRKGVPSAMAVLLVMIGVMGIGVVIVAMVGNSVGDFSQALPRYEARLHEEIGSVLMWLQRSGVEISIQGLPSYVDPWAAMQLGTRMLTGLGEMFTNTFLILLTVTFILFEASTCTQKLQMVWGPGKGSFASFTQFTQDV